VRYIYNTVVRYIYNTVVKYIYNTVVRYIYNTVVRYIYYKCNYSVTCLKGPTFVFGIDRCLVYTGSID
jgi:hypothetical protein